MKREYLLGCHLPHRECSPLTLPHCWIINGRLKWKTWPKTRSLESLVHLSANSLGRLPYTVLLLYWENVNLVFVVCSFAYIFQIIMYTARWMLILHDMHLSCSTNFPVLYKIHKIMPVVSSSLTLIHCDLSTVEYWKDLPSVLSDFPSWAISVSYDLLF